MLNCDFICFTIQFFFSKFWILFTCICGYLSSDYFPNFSFYNSNIFPNSNLPCNCFFFVFFTFLRDSEWIIFILALFVSKDSPCIIQNWTGNLTSLFSEFQLYFTQLQCFSDNSVMILCNSVGFWQEIFFSRFISLFSLN